MLNEDKIRVMTKLAIYEQGKGKKVINNNKYYKKDYVGVKMLNTAITITMAYMICLALWVMYKIDYFVEEIVNIDLFNLGKKVLVIYVIVFILYMLISYAVYSMKYLKMQDMNKEYSENLKELYLIYKKEERSKNDNNKLGGFNPDDEDFDF